MEAPANVPPPIKTWWYPGNSIGYEFIYPRHQALELAKVVNEPVLTTGTDTKDLGTADLTRVTSSGQAGDRGQRRSGSCRRDGQGPAR